MKKSIPTLLCAFALASSLAAEQPQIAFRLLDDYVVKRQAAAERERKVGGIVGLSLGAVFAGASAATWFSGDEIYQSFGGEGSMNSNVKLGLTIGFAATGGVCLWSGFDSLLRKPADLRARYADVVAWRDALYARQRGGSGS